MLNSGKIIMIFFHLIMVLWMIYLCGFLALIVSLLSVSYHFPDLIIYADAFRKGWGACLSSGFSAAGIWPPGCDYHINYLELKAIYNGLLALLPHVKDCL